MPAVALAPPSPSRRQSPSRRHRRPSVLWIGFLGAQFLEALALGLGQHEHGDQDAEHADGGGARFGGEETAGAQEDRKQEDADEAASTLPAAEAMPWPVVRASIGKISAG